MNSGSGDDSDRVGGWDAEVPGSGKTERQRQRLLNAVSAARTRTVQEKVAWILSRDRKARDSDIHLLLEYWKEFHSDVYKGGAITPDLLYRLPRQVTVTRARAKIQNTYRLFLASEEVRAARRSLSEETRRQIAEDRPDAPLITVAADETGKQGRFLIVGSVWALTAEELRSIMAAARDFKSSRSIKWEFHFNQITTQKLSIFIDFVDLVVRPAAAVNFCAISAERAGLDVDRALEKLFTHLLLEGIERVHGSGRAPLPRSLTFWKDKENLAQDRLMLADIKQRLIDASLARFNGQLFLDEFSSIDSKGSEMIQIADLFVSSLNRVLNNPGADGTHPKDQFAAHFLAAVNMPQGPTSPEIVGDMTALVAI